jgi:crotonobetainyl-CoA:carnitine CoA-transferase CaiB-like acyl-CoA transferase
MSTEAKLLTEILAALPGVGAEGLVLETAGGLPSVFPVSELATASVSAAALAAARYAGSRRVTVNRHAASAWFGTTLEPIGWELPSVWDPIAGDYPTRDGWIRLHTNAPHHRVAALAVLGSASTRDAVAEAVAEWDGQDLEDAVVGAGGCAAVMHTREQWLGSAQGIAVGLEPLIAWTDLEASTTEAPQHQTRGTNHPESSAAGTQPLAGIRVLDLTRVLAGPVATRFLALLGADVLRVDPPAWEEGVIPEVTLGKRTTRLDLTHTPDSATLRALLAGADVVVHGYRPGALAALGFGPGELQRIRPGLVEVSLDAYGWTGPLAGRRGFDSLVQMSTGIADAGMTRGGADHPIPLPVQALDQATGYLMAGAVLSALVHRRETGVGRSARLSLARTAHLLLGRIGEGDHSPFPGALEATPEETSWGAARRLRPPFELDGAVLRASPARALGLDAPAWL